MMMKTVTLQFYCVCNGCLDKIKEGAAKATAAGCPNPKLSVDQSKNQVTVTGYLAGDDAAYVAKVVKKKLRRSVFAVVPPAKNDSDGVGARDNKKGPKPNTPPVVRVPPAPGPAGAPPLVWPLYDWYVPGPYWHSQYEPDYLPGYPYPNYNPSAPPYPSYNNPAGGLW